MNNEFITIAEIEQQHRIKGSKLKNIRNKPTFCFPPALNEPGFTVYYERKAVEQWFEDNKELVGGLSHYARFGKGQILDDLTAFYNRNFTRQAGSGGGRTIKIKLRPSEDEHWDNEHQRAMDQSSFGVWGYD